MSGSPEPHRHIILNPLNVELNPIRHLLALVGARHIVHIIWVRVKMLCGLMLQQVAHIFTTEDQKGEDNFILRLGWICGPNGFLAYLAFSPGMYKPQQAD